MSNSSLDLAPPVYATNSEPVTLRKGALGLSGLTAQSVAGVAPSTSIAVPVVVVAIICGNGAWLTWVISTLVMVAVAVCLSLLTRRFVAAGGLYSLNSCGHPIYGAITAWGGLLRGITDGATTPLLFGIFLQSFLVDIGVRSGSITLLLSMILCTVAAGALAWRDTSVSAKFVLAIEGLSLLAVLALVFLVIGHHAGHLMDPEQFRLRGVTLHQIAEGIVLGLGAFGGFESACSFGLEAKQPQKQIAHSVIGSVAGAGILFVLCSYVLTLGFRGTSIATSQSSNPWADLALANGSNALRYLVQLGVLISVFSMFVTNFNVWSRMLLTLSEERLLPRALCRVDRRTRTPGAAILASVLLDIAIQVFLVWRGYATRNLYALICALSGYWVTVTYVFICAAMFTYQWRTRQLRWWHPIVASAGGIPLAMSIVGSAVPLPAFPESIAVFLFAISAIAVTLQVVYLACYRSDLLRRVGVRVEADPALQAAD